MVLPQLEGYYLLGSSSYIICFLPHYALFSFLSWLQVSKPMTLTISASVCILWPGFCCVVPPPLALYSQIHGPGQLACAAFFI